MNTSPAAGVEVREFALDVEREVERELDLDLDLERDSDRFLGVVDMLSTKILVTWNPNNVMFISL